MAWQISGEYFETCSCDYLCPCVTSNLQARPTQGWCTFAFVHHIDRGQFNNTQLDGLNFAVIGRTPEEMAKGNIDAMVVQNPFDMGYQSVRLLLAMLKDDQATIQEMFPRAGEQDGDVYTTGLRLVVPDGPTPLKAEAFDAIIVEFMKLGDFRNWLAKYKLTSS